MGDATFTPGALGIPEEEWETGSPKLRAAIETLYAQLESCRQEIRELQERLHQNSQNTSKPPSSDPPWMDKNKNKNKNQNKDKAKAADPSKKPSGAQVGHPGAHRSLIPLEQVDEQINHYPQSCSQCHEGFSVAALEHSQDPERRQIYELPPISINVIEHRLHTVCCEHCGAKTKAELPPEVPKGSFGPRLQATTALLSGRYRLSRNEVRDFVENVLGVPISEGSIYAIERATSEALQAPYDEVHQAVSIAHERNLDETSYKQSGKLGWLWVVVTMAATLYVIAGSRKRQVLFDAFGDTLEPVKQ
jgi:transposase